MRARRAKFYSIFGGRYVLTAILVATRGGLCDETGEKMLVE